MIAINDDKLYQRFLAAGELLAVLDCNLLHAFKVVHALCFHEESEAMQPFYERYELARCLQKAATNALVAAAWNLLAEEHVETFFRLADQSCREAVAALDFAIEKKQDDRFIPWRDRLKAAGEKSNRN